MQYEGQYRNKYRASGKRIFKKKTLLNIPFESKVPPSFFVCSELRSASLLDRFRPKHTLKLVSVPPWCWKGVWMTFVARLLSWSRITLEREVVSIGQERVLPIVPSCTTRTADEISCFNNHPFHSFPARTDYFSRVFAEMLHSSPPLHELSRCLGLCKKSIS